MVQVQIGDAVMAKDNLGGVALVQVVGIEDDVIIVKGADNATGWRRPEQIILKF